MDWDAAASVAVVIGAFVTAAGVIVTSVINIKSNRLTRQGLEQEQEIAQNSASRAEAAARLNEEYTQRIVDALEVIAARGTDGVAGTVRSVRWELVHHAGDRYRLTNVGERKALAVKVESHETLPLTNFEGGPDLGPEEALTFMALMMLQTEDSTITVRWREDEGGGELTWRYPLPGRPSNS